MCRYEIDAIFRAGDRIPVAVDVAEKSFNDVRRSDLLKYAGGISRDVKGNRQGKMV